MFIELIIDRLVFFFKKLKIFNIFSKLKIFICREYTEINKEELTRYINKIFEQQEKERIARWLINSIRESLELDKVLSSITEEVGKLLKVDRCIIALFEKEENYFHFRSEYRKNEHINSLFEIEKTLQKIPKEWKKKLTVEFQPILIQGTEINKLGNEEFEYMTKKNIKSLIIIPIVNKKDFLGIIMAHQIEYTRKWKDSQLELLNDISGQIAIAIRQAVLYSKIQEATRHKTEFLSGMSHELRTPLNAIIGFSEMLLCGDYGKLNEKQEKFINNIAISGEHLLKLVNDLLDLSKIESGNMEINYELFNVNNVIKETISILNSLALKKNIIINFNADQDLLLRADLRMFKQIMYNLLNNAIKFTEGNNRVDIKVIPEDKCVRIEVCDNGIGIPEKHRNEIFNRFRQIDSCFTRKQEGTGLGLTLTKRIIELHGGDINFESEENKGSRFWFTLPYSSELCNSDNPSLNKNYSF